MTSIRIGLIGLAAASSLMLSTAESFAQKPQKRQRDVITRDEIQGTGLKAGNLHQAIRSLRPHFLAPGRGVRSLGNSIAEPLAVYLNGTRQTGVESLRTIQADAVEEVRYLDPTKAGNEFGPKASGGALMVKLHQEPKAPPPTPVTPPPPPAPPAD